MSVSLSFVIKRDGSTEAFDEQKIAASVEKAGKDTGEYGKKEAEKILQRVKEKLAQIRVKKSTMTVQQIRDVLEPSIAEAGFFATAKYYILFGEKKHQHAKPTFTVIEPSLTETAAQVMHKRYLRTDMDGKVTETPGEMLWRVARHIAKAEIQWGQNGIVDEVARTFYERMVNFKFVCAGKAMFEAGNPGGTGQLSSCFVLPIKDSIQEIFKTLGDAAVVHKNNGGTGFNFSRIRPHGDKVKNVPKASSGPVDFIRAFSAALSQILQGAKRQGANIAILNADHPDILEFVRLKDEDGTIKNFNISVGVTNKFMEAVQANRDWDLVNPRNGEVWKTIKARELFDEIAQHAWATGDPGLAFLDRMQEDNPTPSLGVIDATNPCVTGDQIVATPQGWRKVADIHEGDEIYTVKGIGRVKTVEVHEDTEVFKVRFSDATCITATAAHQFYAMHWEDREKNVFTPIRLDQLRPGDCVQKYQCPLDTKRKTLPYGRIISIKPAGKAKVYDLYEPESDTWLTDAYVSRGCGEIELLPYESCNLTSIVLHKHLKQKKKGGWEIDWDELEKTVKTGVRFLDDMIEVNVYALDAIRQMVKEGNRRIGLGVMGFAHMLYMMGVPYGSEEAVRVSERLAKFIRQKAEEASLELGKVRGAFPNFDVSIYAGSAERYRNCAFLTVAPTGTIALVANTSSGIEPVFSLAQVRRAFNEDSKKGAPTQSFTIVDPVFESFLREKFDDKTRDRILKQLVKDGSLEKVSELTKEEKAIFATTHAIAPEWHIRIQAAWQKWIDNSVSKTINFPHSVTVEDVKKAYLLGWKLGLKGITIYRDGSKADQVLNVVGKEGKLSKDAKVQTHEKNISAGTSSQPRICPECASASIKSEGGCISCPDCGWSKCSL